MDGPTSHYERRNLLLSQRFEVRELGSGMDMETQLVSERPPWRSHWEEKLSFWEVAKLQDVNVKLLAAIFPPEPARREAEPRGEEGSPCHHLNTWILLCLKVHLPLDLSVTGDNEFELCLLKCKDLVQR